MSQPELNRLEAMQLLQARTLTQPDVARRLGISVRQVKRIWRAFRGQGPAGLVSKRRGRPSNRRTDPQLLARAVELIARQYADFGPTLASEKLAQRDGILLPRETLRTAMIAAGLWKARRSRKKRTHPPRERRASVGELIQIDGSLHPWFEERAPRCTLLVFVDDATSRLMGLRFATAETTQNYFDLVEEYLHMYGRPLAFYSDRFGVFRVNVPTQGDGITQFGRAMGELEIEIICANSPQAKGRVERANGILQDRLVKELRLEGISTIEAANALMPQFIAEYNARFAVAPRCDIDAHRPLPSDLDLTRVLALATRRTISRNLTVQYGSKIFAIEPKGMPRRLHCAPVTVREHRTGTICIEHDGQPLDYELCAEVSTKKARILGAKELVEKTPGPPRTPQPNKVRPLPAQHPWHSAKGRRRPIHPEGDICIGPDGDIIALG